MQITMMTNVPMPICYMAQTHCPFPYFDAAGDAEKNDYAEQGFFREIKISEKLLQVSNEALQALATAVQADNVLGVQLANVRSTLEDLADTNFMMFFEIPGGDDLEPRAAHSLQQVRRLLHQQAAKEAPPLGAAAVKALKLLQRHLQDVLMLSCGRFLSQAALHCKGVPPELLARLDAALGPGVLENDDDLWSVIGNSKFHIFTPGASFGKRKHRHGRGGRNSRRSQNNAAEEDSASSAEPSASVDLPCSDMPEGPAYVSRRSLLMAPPTLQALPEKASEPAYVRIRSGVSSSSAEPSASVHLPR